ncbi:pseudouridine synthase deg1 [Vermiconidia calcicola]|uniref:Pseudouridine synthase deg1 n=1 Tax=Vermiconidia calcicola TaxID=1690605 RepID=A0ACC3MW19_9PEZI|nr:pseudouridine synthase deg1 [Vermiconidia calcicola]
MSTVAQDEAMPTGQQQRQQDYDTWSHTDLINRVTDLEAQLKVKNAAHSQRPPSPTPSFKKKPKKSSKPFDPSKYNTRLIALKFAYLGKRYNGFEHHSNNTTPLPTVEEELWKALRKTKLIFPTFKEGQSENEVIALRVRSSRPKDDVAAVGADEDNSLLVRDEPAVAWDSVENELPYIQLLNRVLPPDIRMLAWCPRPPPDFSARFNCKERRYRYFFTNPAFPPIPSESRRGEDSVGGAWLDIEAMHQAAKKLEGVHDFRNFCKVDPSKQISDFRRRIFHAGIVAVKANEHSGAFLDRAPFVADALATGATIDVSQPQWYYFEVRGSAFLWHQVRHMMTILFLIGQGYEQSSVVDDLLNIHKTPAKPVYEMAADTPLVLWDCVFPNLDQVTSNDHGSGSSTGYEDALEWIYVGDAASKAPSTSRVSTGIEDRKYGRLSVMEDVWALWRKTKIDEVLAGSLMDVVARQGTSERAIEEDRMRSGEVSARVFDGSETPRTVGRYIPVVERERLETPEAVNARYAARKGLDTSLRVNVDSGATDE